MLCLKAGLFTHVGWQVPYGLVRLWRRDEVLEKCTGALSSCTVSQRPGNLWEGKIQNRPCSFVGFWPSLPEKAMAPHSSTLAWKIPWTEEPGRLQSKGSLRVGDDWATSLSLFTFMHWRRKWQPTPVFLLGEPRDGGAWWAAVYGVAQSRTRLKQLSSSSSSSPHCTIWFWDRKLLINRKAPFSTKISLELFTT